MLGSVIFTVWFISDALNLPENVGAVEAIKSSAYSKIFFFDDINSSNHFLKHFLGGIFITIGMTGLDQDMMQKNLSCKNVGEAKKNMISMAFVLVVVNLIFLGLGALLYLYATENNIDFEKPDLLFSAIAMSDSAGPFIGVLFLLGLIAAAYSSADSALTSLTTSFSIDFLGVNDENKKLLDKEKIRKTVHIVMSGVIIITVLILKRFTDESAIGLLMKFAGFTYGPLIGMFFFGIVSKRFVADKRVPLVSFISITSTILLWYFSAGAPGGYVIDEVSYGVFGRYKFGFEIIILNAVITFIGLFLVSKTSTNEIKSELNF